MQADRIRPGEQIILRGVFRPGRPPRLRGEVVAPGEDRHVESAAITGHEAAEPPKSDHSKRFARKPNPDWHAFLKATPPHRRISHSDAACCRDEQAKRELGRCR